MNYVIFPNVLLLKWDKYPRIEVLSLNKIFLIVSCCFLIHIGSLIGQKGPEIGAWVGSSFYFGDLNTSYRLGDASFAGGIIGRYNFNERTTIKGSLNYGRIHAEDTDSQNTFENTRNLSFKSHVLDASLQFEFNFLPYVHGSKDEFFTPYIFAGLSVFNFNPKTDLDGVTYTLQNFGTEGQIPGEEYLRLSPAYLIGGGIKWDLSYRWSVNIEIGSRFTFTDYIDDVSGVYPNMQDLAGLRTDIATRLSDRSLTVIGTEGKQRGNNRNNDAYTFIGISFMRYLGQLECPKISNF